MPIHTATLDLRIYLFEVPPLRPPHISLGADLASVWDISSSSSKQQLPKSRSPTAEPPPPPKAHTGTLQTISCHCTHSCGSVEPRENLSAISGRLRRGYRVLRPSETARRRNRRPPICALRPLPICVIRPYRKV